MSEGYNPTESQATNFIANQEEATTAAINAETIDQIDGHNGADLHELLETYTNAGGRKCPYIESMGAAGVELVQKLAEEQKDPNRGPTMRELMEAKKQKVAETAKVPDESKDIVDKVDIRQTEQLHPEPRVDDYKKSEIDVTKKPDKAVEEIAAAIQRDAYVLFHQEYSVETIQPAANRQASEESVVRTKRTTHIETFTEKAAEADHADQSIETISSELTSILEKVADLLPVGMLSKREHNESTDVNEEIELPTAEYEIPLEEISAGTEPTQDAIETPKDTAIEQEAVSDIQQFEADVTEFIMSNAQSPIMVERLESLEPKQADIAEQTLVVITEKIQKLIALPESDIETYEVMLTEIQEHYEELFELLGFNSEDGSIERIIRQIKITESKYEHDEDDDYIDEGMHERKASDTRFFNAMTSSISGQSSVHEALGKVAVALVSVISISAIS